MREMWKTKRGKVRLDYRMGIIKKKERERMSNIILQDIYHLVKEITKKAVDGDINDAYMYAWQICMESEIADSLKKLKQNTPKP